MPRETIGIAAAAPAIVAKGEAERGRRLDDFSFYMSYYGLILGLSVAQVASGFLNAIGARQRVKIGWLTPTLAT